MIHSVIHESHTTPYVEQHRDIGRLLSKTPASILAGEGDEHVMEKILAHRRKMKGYQFPTLMKWDPFHDALCQKFSDFVESDELSRIIGRIIFKIATYFLNFTDEEDTKGRLGIFQLLYRTSRCKTLEGLLKSLGTPSECSKSLPKQLKMF